MGSGVPMKDSKTAPVQPVRVGFEPYKNIPKPEHIFFDREYLISVASSPSYVVFSKVQNPYKWEIEDGKV
jgi:hypothetical protein